MKTIVHYSFNTHKQLSLHVNGFILDSVYSERYMGQPDLEGNFKGYESSDLISRASHFHPTEKTLRKMYLIHGTRDDNVHLQHSMVLAKALIDKGVNFKQQVRNHSREKNKTNLLFQ